MTENDLEVQGFNGSGFKGSGFKGSRFKGYGFNGSGFSAAAGLKSGQSNRERNFEKANNEYRIHQRRTVSIERPTSNVE